MNSKVSIIIPNYNASKYITKCIDSIINQTYKNIEIIIIDDGSIDDSWEKIKGFTQKYSNIIAIQQVNMNASIARNKGIDIATGKYALFLDSDDELFDNSIEILVNELEENNTDLVMGNFVLINEENAIINEEKVTLSSQVCNSPFEYIGATPNPSNKLFNLQIVKEKKIYFGNVRIGQDLNFFLKYMLFCRSISIINENIYKWRVLKNSMSNSYNFRIFDIVESFNDVKQFYNNNNNIRLYEDYIQIIEYKHYYFQMEKQKNFKSQMAKKIVIDFFSLKIKELNIVGCKNIHNYKDVYKKCKIKMFFKHLYSSRLYSKLF